MSENNMDISKVLAVLAQPKEEMKPLEQVERLKIEVSYINKEAQVVTRPVKIVIPQNAAKPMPLIYIPHYEMGEDSVELRDYLANGWAVACPTEVSAEDNAALTENDLVFNNAALHMLRHRAEFDKNRIILIGGSAGAYMALMLSGMQLGLCATIANGPVANIYFTNHYYAPKAAELNYKAMVKLLEEEADKPKESNPSPEKKQEPMDENSMKLALLSKFQKLPLPFVAMFTGVGEPTVEKIPDISDYTNWEAVSPVGVADCFSSPVMVNHNTSDVLVLVDQITRRYTYEKPGASLPETFIVRLPEDTPGKLKYSLEECLPEEKLRMERIIVPEHAEEETDIPYDGNKQFNINIFDDGPMEGYGTHSSRMDVGRRHDIPYVKEMFEQSAAKSCMLTAGMLRSMLERYQGKSIALPAHRGVNDRIYGSLAMYQEEICEELIDWTNIHGQQMLMTIYEQVLECETDTVKRENLKSVMKQIEQRIK